MKNIIRILAACIGFSCAVPAGAELLTATRQVVAIMAGELFLGEAVGNLSGAGTLHIHSQRNPALTCRGQFTSHAKTGGTGQLECSDGATATFRFERLSVLSGHGTGDSSEGAMSFVYGLTREEASPFLILPEGKRLLHNGTELALVDR